MKNLHIFSVSLLLAFVFGGCSSDEVAVESQVKDQQALFTLDPVHGFLRFKDQEAFKQTLDYLFKHQASLDSFEASIPGFVSQRAAYNAIDTDEERMEIVNNPQGHPYRNFLVIQEGFDGELEAVRVVQPGLIAAVVSKDGLIMIDGHLVKYTPEATIYFEEKEKTDVAFLKNYPQKGSSSEGLVVNPIIRQRPENNGLETLVGQCAGTYNIDSRTFRVQGEWKSEKESLPPVNGIPAYVHFFGGYTKHTKKSGLFWFSDKANVLRVGANGTVNFSGATVNQNVNLEDTDVNSIEAGFFLCPYCIDVTITTNFTGAHFGSTANKSAQCQMTITWTK